MTFEHTSGPSIPLIWVQGVHFVFASHNTQKYALSLSTFSRFKWWHRFAEAGIILTHAKDILGIGRIIPVALLYFPTNATLGYSPVCLDAANS